MGPKRSMFVSTLPRKVSLRDMHYPWKSSLVLLSSPATNALAREYPICAYLEGIGYTQSKLQVGGDIVGVAVRYVVPLEPLPDIVREQDEIDRMIR